MEYKKMVNKRLKKRVVKSKNEVMQHSGKNVPVQTFIVTFCWNVTKMCIYCKIILFAASVLL